MAVWGRAHLIKASLLAGILVLLLNFYNFRLDSKAPTDSLMLSKRAEWPKRTQTTPELANSTLANRDTTQPIQHLHPSADKHNSSDPQFLSHNSSSPSLRPAIQTLGTLNFSRNNVILEDNNTVNTTIDLNVVVVSPTSTQPDGGEIASADNSITKPNLVQTIMQTLGLNTCPPIPPNLDGPLTPNITVEEMSVLESRFGAKLQPGGWYHPAECKARNRVAIVVPYRNRRAHLAIFLANLHAFLMKQQIEYGIFIVEQSTEGMFNRAALMNIGFVEAQKMSNWDCFIFHDIDLLPLDDRNLYTCPDQPRHMSVAIDTFGFRLPYSLLFGGVSALTVDQFKKVNGFSNSFWGWGGEDDDMSNRIRHFGFHIARYPVNISRYMMLYHKKETANPHRYDTLVKAAKKYDVDGLNSMKYDVRNLEKKVLYTWILVDITPEPVVR